MKVEFYRHNLNEKDRSRVNEVLRSTFLTTGPVTREFEDAFSEYLGLSRVVGLNSCTGAIHLSLLALGIGKEDQVITTPMTFIATATAIMHAGAEPVLVDVERDTGLIDVSKIEAAITPQTRAIVPVHLYGTMTDMRPLAEIADHYDLKIVEDCAHCIEGERDGVRPGQVSDCACFSFYATKNLTCGEGGAIATRSHELADKVGGLSLHGMSKDAASRYEGKYEHWDMVDLGWKYNMSDICAALLVEQMGRLDDNWQRRKAICEMYDEGLRSIPHTSIPLREGKCGHHLYTVWVDADKRDVILHRLQEKEVGVAVNYRAIHTLSFFKKRFGFDANDYPAAYDIGRRTITLPLYPSLTDEEVDYVIESVKAVVQQCTGGP
jgi:dTDP-4-amino-4,6-dideoxygalactose transaminase